MNDKPCRCASSKAQSAQHVHIVIDIKYEFCAARLVLDAQETEPQQKIEDMLLLLVQVFLFQEILDDLSDCGTVECRLAVDELVEQVFVFRIDITKLQTDIIDELN